MIESFGNKIAEEIWVKDFSRRLPKELHVRAKALMTIMHAISDLGELETRGRPPSLRLHKLKGNRSHEFAIDIHKTVGWRITFEFKSGSFRNVKIEDYHK